MPAQKLTAAAVRLHPGPPFSTIKGIRPDALFTFGAPNGDSIFYRSIDRPAPALSRKIPFGFYWSSKI
jgi:hypothetical protein